MKLFKNLLLSTVAFVSISAQAQTADEVVAKMNTAMGGVEKIKTLTSVKRSGTMNAQGMDIPMTITIVHLKGMRMDMEIMGTSNYQIMTPTSGSMFFPISQMTEPKELDADAVKGGQSQLDIHSGFVDYKEKGNVIEMVGSEKVNGADAFKLKMTKVAGKTVNYFVDKKTFYIIKTTAMEKGQDGTEAETETFLSDYKQNKDGYWFAYTINTPRGNMTFDTIESNVKVDENIFKN